MVEETARDQFNAMAKTAGVSAAVFFEALVAHVTTELTDQGIPSWYTLPSKGDTLIDEI